MVKSLVVGSDGTGYPLKEAVKQHLESMGCRIADIGTIDPENPVDYFVVGSRVGKAVSSGEFERGIVFCGNGMGVGITAGKYPGVYAAVCESAYMAKRSRVINNANVLAMGVQFVAPHIGICMAEEFLGTEFCEGLGQRDRDYLTSALEEIRAIERTLCK